MPESAFSQLSVGDFLEMVAAKIPAPGGGAVASCTGGLAAALASMVVAYSLGKKHLADHQPRLDAAAAALERARALMMELAEEDAAAYAAVNELSRLPEGDPRRAEQLGPAQAAAIAAPMSVAAGAADLLRLFEDLAPITNRHLRSDLAIAAVLAAATARSALWNVRVNVPPGDARGAATVAQAERLVAESEAAARPVEAACA